MHIITPSVSQLQYPKTFFPALSAICMRFTPPEVWDRWILKRI